MTNLDEYIKKELKKGFSKAEIKRTLLKTGWKEEDVVNALEKDYEEEYTQHKYKTKRFWLVSITLIFIIILAAAIIYTIPYLNQVNVEECMKEDSFWKVHTCMVKNNLLGENKNVLKTKCDGIKDDNNKNSCFIELAKDKDDVKFCSKININEIKWECQTAPWRNNECEYKVLLGEDAKQCFIDLAIETKNTNICMRKNVYVDCIIEVSQTLDDINYCNGNHECITNFAILKKDISICEQGPLKSKCKNEFEMVK
jgi:hypothetical protein